MPTYKYIATDIEWETDGDKEALKSLPKTVKGTITARDRELVILVSLCCRHKINITGISQYLATNV